MLRFFDALGKRGHWADDMSPERAGMPREIVGSISILDIGSEQYELTAILIPTIRVFDAKGAMTFVPSQPISIVKLDCR